MAVKRSEERAREDTKAILNRIRQLVRALRTFDRQAQSRYGFGAAQMFILHVLAGEGELSLNELADRTATDQSSVSLAVGRLVADGHVRRAADTADRRQVRLSLTPRARALVKRSPPAAQERIMESVREMSALERTQLVKLMDKLMAGMIPPGAGRVPMFFQEEGAPRKPRAGSKKR